MLYVDASAFAFTTRQELKIGAYLVFNHFFRFGLQMHIGNSIKPSKTECVFSLPPDISNYPAFLLPPPKMIPLLLFTR